MEGETFECSLELTWYSGGDEILNKNKSLTLTGGSSYISYDALDGNPDPDWEDALEEGCNWHGDESSTSNRWFFDWGSPISITLHKKEIEIYYSTPWPGNNTNNL